VTEARTILKNLRHTIEEHRVSLSSQQAPVVGWCCSYVPVEVLESAGLVPIRLLPHPPAEMGDCWLHPNFCPYVRAIMGEGLVGAYPFLSGVVIMNTCDNMRRLFDAWSHFHNLSFFHLMDLPRITTLPAIAYFRQEIEALIDRITSHFGVSISTEALTNACEASNRTHSLFQQVQNLMDQGNLDLADYEWDEILRGQWIIPRETYDSFLDRLIRASDNAGGRAGMPILLTGSMLENPDIVAIIEDCGGRIAARDLCVTGRQAEQLISLTGDPLLALARHYLLRPPCARMQDVQRRIEYVLGLVRSHKAQGVIY
jgi:benzoyl-CoA reductase/2-hydroxyglutaryl-CoA dehydratase subunit BcrC/BadD/HgdB